jgi:hypothetical protein
MQVLSKFFMHRYGANFKPQGWVNSFEIGMETYSVYLKGLGNDISSIEVVEKD